MIAQVPVKHERTPDADAASTSSPQILRPEHVVLQFEVLNRRQALESAAEIVGQLRGIDAAPVFRALWRREQVGSTAIGQGVAIPHARIAGIAKPVILFLRTRYAIEFHAPDNHLVNSILVIMVPEKGSTDDHLQLLALVAQTFADHAFRDRLAAASTPAEVDAVFARATDAV